MKNTATGLLVGLALGALGYALVQRIRDVIADEDLDVLTDRLAEQIQVLERRILPQSNS